MIVILLFTIALAVKGGWVGKFIKTPRWVDNHVPPLLIGAAAYLASGELTQALLFGVGTYVFKISMGEEAGAIINTKAGNPYVDNPKDFGREFGVKKGIQRGVLDGTAFSLLAWNPVFIFAGLTFVPVYWGMTKVKDKFTNQADWAWAEPVYGAIFGIATLIAFS